MGVAGGQKAGYIEHRDLRRTICERDGRGNDERPVRHTWFRAGRLILGQFRGVVCLCYGERG
eukprot:63991-Lingulodinium_polyedra.AAC.1